MGEEDVVLSSSWPDRRRRMVVVTPEEWRDLRAERDALAERVEWLRAALKQEEGFGSIIAAAALRADDEARGA